MEMLIVHRVGMMGIKVIYVVPCTDMMGINEILVVPFIDIIGANDKFCSCIHSYVGTIVNFGSS